MNSLPVYSLPPSLSDVVHGSPLQLVHVFTTDVVLLLVSGFPSDLVHGYQVDLFPSIHIQRLSMGFEAESIEAH